MHIYYVTKLSSLCESAHFNSHRNHLIEGEFDARFIDEQTDINNWEGIRNSPRIMPSGELGQSSGSDLYCSVVQAVTTGQE